jgi:hypothetical protein
MEMEIWRRNESINVEAVDSTVVVAAVADLDGVDDVAAVVVADVDLDQGVPSCAEAREEPEEEEKRPDKKDKCQTCIILVCVCVCVCVCVV